MQHLTENQIASFIDNRLEANEKSIIIEHIVQCDSCYNQLLETYFIVNDKTDKSKLKLDERIKKEALSFGLQYASTADSIKINFRKKRARLSFAVIFTAVILFVLFTLNRKEDEIQFRDSSGKTTLDLITPPEYAPINNKKLFFEWEKINYVLTYRIKVYDELGRVMVDTSVENNSIDLTGKLNISKSAKYFWDVNAIFSDGQVINSKLNAFTVK